MTDRPPEALRRRIAEDLRPVAALRLGRRAVPLAAAAAALSTYLLYRGLGLRWDFSELGVWVGWGLSIAQLGIAFALLGLVLRQAFPGHEPSRTLLVATGGAGVLVHWLDLAITYRRSPVAVPPGSQAELWLYCLGFELGLGLVLVTLILGQVRRGLVTSPPQAAVAGAVAAGLAGDAVWRLFCPYSEAAHTLVSHTGGVACVVLAGWLIGLAWERRQLVLWRKR